MQVLGFYFDRLSDDILGIFHDLAVKVRQWGLALNGAVGDWTDHEQKRRQETIAGGRASRQSSSLESLEMFTAKELVARTKIDEKTWYKYGREGRFIKKPGVLPDNMRSSTLAGGRGGQGFEQHSSSLVSEGFCLACRLLGLGELPGLCQPNCQLVVRFSVVRRRSNRFAEILDRLLGAPCIEIDLAQLYPTLFVFGFEDCHFFEFKGSLCPFAFLQQLVSEQIKHLEL